MLPLTRQPSMVSFMRLRQRRKVDLPQPEGPISAMTWLRRDVEAHVVDRLLLAVEDVDVARRILGASTKASPTVSPARASRMSSCPGRMLSFP